MNASSSALIDDPQSAGWIRRLQLQRPIRPVPVVVLNVDSQDLLQVPPTHAEQPVQTLGPAPSGSNARRRRWRWVPAPASALVGRPPTRPRRRRCGRTSRHDREQGNAPGVLVPRGQPAGCEPTGRPRRGWGWRSRRPGDQLLGGLVERRSSLATARVGPRARDEPSLPAQRRLRGDEEAGPASSGQCAAERREQGAVGGLEHGRGIRRSMESLVASPRASSASAWMERYSVSRRGSTTPRWPPRGQRRCQTTASRLSEPAAQRPLSKFAHPTEALRRLTPGGVPAPRTGMTAGRSAARRSRSGPRAGASS